MATVILTQENVALFRQTLTKFQADVSTYLNVVKGMKDYLDEGTGKKFQDGYDYGKTATKRLKEVLDILSDKTMEGDFEELERVLQEYIDNANINDMIE